ncbi:MAG: hypothetical protein JZD40_03575 [Sulfolobus sp.]|nr:hypothetical protein [Sulfolobus sp.]
MNRKLLTISVVFFILAIVIGVFTYTYSNTIAEKFSSSISLSPESTRTWQFKVISGDTIVIKGNSTGPVYIVFPPPVSYMSGELNGSFYKSFTVHKSLPILVGFEAGLLPVNSKSFLINVTFTIIIYNTWINNYGYPIVGLFVVLGLIFLGYAKVITPSSAVSKGSKQRLSNRRT